MSDSVTTSEPGNGLVSVDGCGGGILRLVVGLSIPPIEVRVHTARTHRGLRTC